MAQPEAEMQRIALDDDFRVAIVGAGGFGRVALDVLLAGGLEQYVIGFYDDAHAALPERVHGFPVLGDIEMLKSMLSVEPVYVVVAITDNATRLKVANSVRARRAAGSPRPYTRPRTYPGRRRWVMARCWRRGRSCIQMRRWAATARSGRAAQSSRGTL